MNDAPFWIVLAYAISLTIAFGAVVKAKRQRRDSRGRFVKR